MAKPEQFYSTLLEQNITYNTNTYPVLVGTQPEQTQAKSKPMTIHTDQKDTETRTLPQINEQPKTPYLVGTTPEANIDNYPTTIYTSQEDALSGRKLNK